MSVYLSEYIDPACRARLEERFEVVDTFEEPEEVELPCGEGGVEGS